jgi:small GTP-binding protein
VTRSVVKVAMVGSGGAGKTTIASRLVTGAFVETMMTIGVNIETWSIMNEDTGGTVRAAVFDLGGQQQFRFFQTSLLCGTEAVLIVVDMTRMKSLIDVDEWVPLILHVPRDRWILVGNKVDEECVVHELDIRAKAESLTIPYVLVSAKTGDGFDILSKKLASLVLLVADT